MIEIAGRLIGDGQPCFIIAEAGVNHNGSVKAAKRLVDAAAAAGADVVKFQTFQPEKLVSAGAPKANYQLQTTDPAETQREMLRKLMLSRDDHTTLQAYCIEKGILFLSSAFDEDSADFLDSLGLPAFKLGSGELTNLPLLAHIARKGKPMIVSTGMAYLSDVEAALRCIYKAGNTQVALLHCVSNYPTAPADANLRAMQTMRRAFGVPVGYSDHTMGRDVSLAATALGASILEKHITLDHTLPGPDQQASLEPQELTALVQGVRSIEAALGHGRKEPAPSERNTAEVARRSIVAAADLPAGHILKANDLSMKRPGTGLPPSMLAYLIGRRVRTAILADTLITLDHLE